MHFNLPKHILFKVVVFWRLVAWHFEHYQSNRGFNSQTNQWRKKTPSKQLQLFMHFNNPGHKNCHITIHESIRSSLVEVNQTFIAWSFQIKTKLFFGLCKSGIQPFFTKILCPKCALLADLEGGVFNTPPWLPIILKGRD